MNNECKEAGRKYVEAGINVIPVNAWKKPALETWKEYQNGTRSTIENIDEWSTEVGVCGWAAVCGEPSGGLIVFDFDADGFFEKWCASIGDIAKNLAVQQTGSGLYQAWLKCDLPLRNEKLAFVKVKKGDKEELHVAIETRANGGYAVAAPSFCPQAEKNGKKHERSYRVIQGDFSNIPILYEESVQKLYKAARELDESDTYKGAKVSKSKVEHSDDDFSPSNAAPTDYQAYGQKALADELRKLAGTSEGNRNDQLNKSAFALGQLIGAGVLDWGAVEAALAGVAASIRLTGAEIRSTIRSGLDSGVRKPRQLPEKPSVHGKQKQKKTVPPLIKNLDIAAVYAQETGLKLLTDPPQVDKNGFTPCSVLYRPDDPSHTAFINVGEGKRWGYYIELKAGQPWVGGNLSKTLAEKGNGPYASAKQVYAYLKKTAGATRGAWEAGDKTPRSPEIDTKKPIIPITDRYLDSISNDAIRALETANNPPFIFVRAGSLARVSLDEKGVPKIQMMNETQLRGDLARNARFMRETEKGSKPTAPPKDVAKDILHLGDWPLPALQGIVQSPVMRPDGTVLVEPGYDPITHLYYVKPSDLSIPVIPETPSESDVDGYLDYLLDAIRDFPFVADADRANALALVMTLPLRPAIAGHVPMAVITAPAPGTGKSLLTDVVALVGTGQLAPMTGFPGNDEEMRKAITSFLMEGAPIIPFDNIETPLWGPSLSRAITCSTWKDRILGGNTTAHLPQKAVWLCNGNNVRLRGDLPRRTFPIRLDARLVKPWERDNFKHKNLREWVLKWRGDLLACIYTIARAWYVAGKPKPQRPVPVMGGFEEWASTIGGILAFAGVESFLENLAQFHDEADLEGPEWEAFLTAWVEIFGDTPKTCQEITAIIRQNSGFASVLPDNLQDVLQNPEKSFKRSLGKALARKEKRPFGENNLALQRAGAEKRAVLWMVASL